MKLLYELEENDLKKLVLENLREMFPNADITLDNVKIEVKSKQNYKSEWEQASFRARVEIGR